MVKGMAPGSVIVDLAAERGGNCELTRMEETISVNAVTIIGLTNLAGTIPYHASQMYARNLMTYLTYMAKDGKLQMNMQDEITRETLVTHRGEIVNARVREFLKLPALAPAGS
jgi:NAD(P) transhydrogenase subunit alpha